MRASLGCEPQYSKASQGNARINRFYMLEMLEKQRMLNYHLMNLQQRKQFLLLKQEQLRHLELFGLGDLHFIEEFSLTQQPCHESLQRQELLSQHLDYIHQEQGKLAATIANIDMAIHTLHNELRALQQQSLGSSHEWADAFLSSYS